MPYPNLQETITTGGETPHLRCCLNHGLRGLRGKEGFGIVELLCRITVCATEDNTSRPGNQEINGMNAV